MSIQKIEELLRLYERKEVGIEELSSLLGVKREANIPANQAL